LNPGEADRGKDKRGSGNALTTRPIAVNHQRETPVETTGDYQEGGIKW